MGNNFDINNVANERGLRVITTTTDLTGYPKNLKNALIGFECFKDAEELANKYGLRLTTFFKRDGWSLWYRNNNEAYQPIQIVAEDYGGNCNSFVASDAIDFFDNEIRPYLNNFNNIDSLQRFLEEKGEILNEIEILDEDELVIVKDGAYYTTIKKEVMSWSHDTKNYIIGLI